MSDDVEMDNFGTDGPSSHPRLTEGMKRLYEVSMPPGVIAGLEELDETVLRAAEDHFAGRLPSQVSAGGRLRWRWAGLGVAAGLLLGVIWLSMQPANRVDTPVIAVRAGDVDGSGRIDILDAFTLAREVKMGLAVDPRHDLSGDGRIDQRDIDLIAREAVTLPKGDPS